MGLWSHLLPRDDNYYNNVTAKPSALRASEEARLRFTSQRQPSRPRSHLVGSWLADPGRWDSRDLLPVGSEWEELLPGRLDLCFRFGSLSAGCPAHPAADATSAPRSAPHCGAGAGGRPASRAEHGNVWWRLVGTEVLCAAPGSGGCICIVRCGGVGRRGSFLRGPRPCSSSLAPDISLFSREGGRGSGENGQAL